MTTLRPSAYEDLNIFCDPAATSHPTVISIVGDWKKKRISTQQAHSRLRLHVQPFKQAFEKGNVPYKNRLYQKAFGKRLASLSKYIDNNNNTAPAPQTNMNSQNNMDSQFAVPTLSPEWQQWVDAACPQLQQQEGLAKRILGDIHAEPLLASRLATLHQQWDIKLLFNADQMLLAINDIVAFANGLVSPRLPSPPPGNLKRPPPSPSKVTSPAQLCQVYKTFYDAMMASLSDGNQALPTARKITADWDRFDPLEDLDAHAEKLCHHWALVTPQQPYMKEQFDWMSTQLFQMSNAIITQAEEAANNNDSVDSIDSLPPEAPPDPSAAQVEALGTPVPYGPVGQALLDHPERAADLDEEQHSGIMGLMSDYIEHTKEEERLYFNKTKADNEAMEQRKKEQDVHIQSNKQAVASAFKDKAAGFLFSPSSKKHRRSDRDGEALGSSKRPRRVVKATRPPAPAPAPSVPQQEAPAAFNDPASTQQSFFTQQENIAPVLEPASSEEILKAKAAVKAVSKKYDEWMKRRSSMKDKVWKYEGTLLMEALDVLDLKKSGMEDLLHWRRQLFNKINEHAPVADD